MSAADSLNEIVNNHISSLLEEYGRRGDSVERRF